MSTLEQKHKNFSVSTVSNPVGTVATFIHTSRLEPLISTQIRELKLNNSVHFQLVILKVDTTLCLVFMCACCM